MLPLYLREIHAGDNEWAGTQNRNSIIPYTVAELNEAFRS